MANVIVRGNRIVVQHEGHEFEVWVGENNQFYLYDPHLILDTEHVALPTERRVVSRAAPGLGDMTRTAITSVVPTALAFVPVVGPILSAVASVAGALTGSMFGGNDPTPMSSLQNRVLQLRQGIVDAHTAMGIPDAMPTIDSIRSAHGLPTGVKYKHDFPDLAVILELWPDNVKTNDPNHWKCDFSGVNCKGCGHVRKCSYAAINKLTPIYEQLSSQLHDKQLVAQVMSQIGAQGVAPSSSAPGPGIPAGGGGGYYGGDGSSNPGGVQPSALEASMLGSAESVLPLAIAGVALIVALSQQKGSARRASKRI